MVDREDRVLIEDGEGDRRVEQADMVQRDDRVRAGLGKMLEPMDLQAVNEPEQDRAEIAQRIGRQPRENPDGRDERLQSDGEENLGDREVQNLERDRDGDGAAGHEQGRQHVHRRDDARPMVGARP